MRHASRRGAHLASLTFVFALLALLLSGCGSGGSIFGGARIPGGATIGNLSPGNGDNGGVGTLKVELIFPVTPAKAKGARTAGKVVVDFPNTTTVTVHVLDRTTHEDVIAPITRPRPANALEMSISVPGLAPGTYDVLVSCSDDQGNSAGYSIPQAQVVANETVTVRVTGTVTVSTVGITPPTATVAAGATQQYTLVATFSDNSTLDVTAVADWALSGQSNGATVAMGLVRSVNAGSMNVVGTLGVQSATAALIVTGTSPTPSPSPSPSPTPTPDTNFYAFDRGASQIMQFDAHHTHFLRYGSPLDTTGGVPQVPPAGQFARFADRSIARDDASGKVFVYHYYLNLNTFEIDNAWITSFNTATFDGSGLSTWAIDLPTVLGAPRAYSIGGIAASGGKFYILTKSGSNNGYKSFIHQYDAADGANHQVFEITDVNYLPDFLAVRNGELFVVQDANVGANPDRVAHWSGMGDANPPTVITLPTTASTDGFAVDGLGRIYISDYNESKVLRYSSMSATQPDEFPMVPTVNSAPQDFGPYLLQVNGAYEMMLNGENDTDYAWFFDSLGAFIGREFGPTGGNGDWQTANGGQPSW